MKRLLFISLLATLIAACESDTSRLKGYDIQGIDVSHYQGRIDWATVAAQDFRFAFVKATEGRNHIDTLFCTNWTAIKQAGMKRGAYHFFRPSMDGEVQARNFMATVELNYGDLPPVVDIEIDENLPRETVIAELKKYLYWIELTYSIRPIIYTHYKFYNKIIAGEFDKYPIWIAKYGGDVPRLGVGVKPMFWQYGNRGKIQGVNGYVDMNVFFGTADELEGVCLSGSMLSGLTKY
jgi:lysozyme